MTEEVKKDKPAVRIEQWRIVGVGKGKRVLIGLVFGHPYINEGAMARSSLIVRHNKKAGTVETLNTLYVLGEPSKDTTKLTPSVT